MNNGAKFSGNAATLDELVSAFEQAWSGDVNPDVSKYFPDRSHPEYEMIACELLCVDLEFRGADAGSNSIRDYQQRFPQLLGRPEVLEQIAFEEYRIRKLDGDTVTPAHYSRTYDVDTSNWPQPGSSNETLGASADKTVQASSNGPSSASNTPFPSAGDEVLQFRIIEQLGEGKFGRVFLARQEDLANRFVAIKLTRQRWDEADRLARLQHTNIVPIHSLHLHGNGQLVCMPFLGRHTLKDFLATVRGRADWSGEDYGKFIGKSRDSLPETTGAVPAGHAMAPPTDELSHESISLWMMTQLTAGLAHAHQRSILHRDLKPANVLLKFDGDPLLLDFNLSSDADGRIRETLVGGTIPYMAPEHIRSLSTGSPVGPQADLYSLGVIFFQLVGDGRLPYPAKSASGQGALVELLADRALPAKVNPEWNISRSTRSIIEKCLAPQFEQRYQTAHDLLEDLSRQRSHRPLVHVRDRLSTRIGKFLRRHPQLKSAGVITLVSGLAMMILATAVLTRGERIAHLNAEKSFGRFVASATEARAVLSTPPNNEELYDAAIRSAEKAIDTFPVESLVGHQEYARLEPFQQRRVRETLAELHFLLAFSNELRATIVEDAHRGPFLQQAILHNELGQRALNNEPSSAFQSQQNRIRQKINGQQSAGRALVQSEASDSRFDRYVSSLANFQSGYLGSCVETLQKLSEETPRDFLVWHLLGNSYLALGNPKQAEDCFTHSSALTPESALAPFHRGLARLEIGESENAVADFSRVLHLSPANAAALLNRALAKRKAGRIREAISDLNEAEKTGRYRARIHFMRAKMWSALGESDKADADIVAGSKLVTKNPDDLISRGLARLTRDPTNGVKDLREAVRLRPRNRQGLHNLAVALADHQHDHPAAEEVFTRILKLYPDDSSALRGRAVVSARQGKREEAIIDLAKCFKQDRSAQTFYQAACVYSQLSRVDSAMSTQATGLLKTAFGSDGKTWWNYAKADPDLDPIRESAAFKSLMRAATDIFENSH